jgi:carbonic anhydrase
VGETTLLDAVLRANEARARGEEAVADLPPGRGPFVITCMDPRLSGVLLPAMGLGGLPTPQARFAGGIVRQGDTSGARSVLSAAIFNMATEILLVGHTDCRMGKTSAMEIRSGLSRLGVRPDAFDGQDPPTWLGTFVSERQSVEASVAVLRADPRIPPAMPVHGLLYNLETRRLEVVIRGYDAARAGPPALGGGADSGYRPGPASLAAPAGATFGGTPVPVPGFAPSPAMGQRGPVSFGAAPPPLVPPGGLQPPSFPAPPAMAVPQQAAPEEMRLDTPSAPPPPPPPPTTAEEHEARIPQAPKPAKRKGKGGSPFDRAQETLDRLRRDRDR